VSDVSNLTSRWVGGWAAARSLPAPDDLGDGLSVECHQPGRDFEIFAQYADDDPASVTRLAHRVADADEATWLTVPTTRPEQVASLLQDSGLILLKRNEKLMVADMQGQHRHAVPEPYRLHIEPGQSSVYVEVRDPAGEPAARGAVGLAGTDAVIDRILTWPDHRRRGLANAVMSALADHALRCGAGFGLLIASEDGQRLYATLGWTAVADVLIAAAPGTAYPEN
jgi:GNAT superfamily N-acetyltransferase